jgi:hypothetical protein
MACRRSITNNSRFRIGTILRRTKRLGYDSPHQVFRRRRMKKAIPPARRHAQESRPIFRQGRSMPAKSKLRRCLSIFVLAARRSGAGLRLDRSGWRGATALNGRVPTRRQARPSAGGPSAGSAVIIAMTVSDPAYLCRVRQFFTLEVLKPVRTFLILAAPPAVVSGCSSRPGRDGHRPCPVPFISILLLGGFGYAHI